MLKSLTFSLLFLLATQLCLSQIQSGDVTYKIKPLAEKFEASLQNAPTGLSPAGPKSWFANIAKALPYLTYHLTFTRQEALFKSKPYLANDNGIDVENAANFAGTAGQFYANISENMKLHQLHKLYKDWLVEYKFDDIKWEITDETKEIQGYTCKKATAIYRSIGIPKGEVVAWFAPKIPFSFGPSGYGGLPGLILEVEHFFFKIYAADISFSAKKQRIKAPTKGKRISVEDYYRQSEQIGHQLRNAMRK